MRNVQAVQGTRCPCHGSGLPATSSTEDDVDYAFEMASSTVRFGRGVTAEVGQDMESLGVQRLALFTDSNIQKLRSFEVVCDSLARAGVPFEVYDRVSVEPTDKSFMDAIEFAKSREIDSFLALGGGSVMDTAKAANLYASYPDADLLDFVNAPVGKGLPVPGPVMPLICIPTTAGTGSETTGVAIFDYEPLQAKTGIGSRWIRPMLGIIDVNNSATMPVGVATASGFDVLCHALESYTAIPYNKRSPRPKSPVLRPAYQGANPMSDIWCMKALQSLGKHFKRSVQDQDDLDAKEAMLLASTMAGVGFGNAGVHLAHGMSYSISGLNKRSHVRFQYRDYDTSKPLVPHGISVCVTAPAIFETTSATNPRRHIDAAEALGASIPDTMDRDDAENAAGIIRDTLLKYMQDLNVPMGLSEIGYRPEDIPDLVEGTLPQHRVTKLAPNQPIEAGILTTIFENSMRY
eukprot:CAMPEP_0119128258 /NCGR_PEP_ID=MMETSP1310-20130426/6489_1 /TAXON_ID=464262 /ORGANISM="Genus nov. species nov., Strain RCC2339" /LENGTH=461 /DNA_ID=CAMNT_0007118585 /DNA_START=179 /DNA_END=1564 /DNA_ORIENTATION=+